MEGRLRLRVPVETLANVPSTICYLTMANFLGSKSFWVGRLLRFKCEQLGLPSRALSATSNSGGVVIDYARSIPRDNIDGMKVESTLQGLGLMVTVPDRILPLSHDNLALL